MNQESDFPKYALRIWIRPRNTFRKLINQDPTYLVIPFALVSGLAEILDRGIGRSIGDFLSLPTIILIVFILGPIGGLVGVYLGAEIASWIGNKLGGKGTSEELRLVLAWSSIPMIVSVVFIDFSQILLYGEEAFKSETPLFDARLVDDPNLSFTFLVITFGAMIIGLLSAVWRLYILVAGVAEVHQFSMWRASATLILPYLMVVIISFAFFSLF